MAAGLGSPCGACRFLRRKCASDCIFAPYFSSDQGAVQFAAIHKVFGASNVSKLLLNLPAKDRSEAVVTISYEAQARVRDPVYGCVSHIFALQQQVSYLQAQLMQVKAELAAAVADSGDFHHRHWAAGGFTEGGTNPFPHSSLECIQQAPNDTVLMGFHKDTQSFTLHDYEMGELHELALRMMRS